MANPDICRQCDTKGQSCCSLNAECKGTFRAPVSDGEIGRILNHFTNRKSEELFESRFNSQTFMERISALFPDMEDAVRKAFQTGDTHHELKTENGSCVLKDANGCLLPDKIRPLFCRIYPFWFFGEEPQIFLDPNCIALSSSKTIPEVFLCLGTTPERLKLIYSRLCHDWGLSRSIPREQKRMVL